MPLFTGDAGNEDATLFADANLTTPFEPAMWSVYDWKTSASYLFDVAGGRMIVNGASVLAAPAR